MFFLRGETETLEIISQSSQAKYYKVCSVPGFENVTFFSILETMKNESKTVDFSEIKTFTTARKLLFIDHTKKRSKVQPSNGHISTTKKDNTTPWRNSIPLLSQINITKPIHYPLANVGGDTF